MEYGKPFGIGASGGLVIFGVSVGYGWVVTGAIAGTAITIFAIRYFFRPHKPLGKD